MTDKLVVFKGKETRRVLHDGEWYFAVVDVIAALTDSEKPRDYWYRMKKRDKASSGFELSTMCRQLKIKSSDGKMYSTEVANTDGKRYKTKHYNLDVIISVGYRVKSQRGTQFRIWATSVLKDHLVKGDSLNRKRLAEKGAKELQQVCPCSPIPRKAMSWSMTRGGRCSTPLTC